jgi:hypothetical protein
MKQGNKLQPHEPSDPIFGDKGPMPCQIGDAWHAREGDNAAIVGADAGLALSLERGACHRLGYVARTRRRGKPRLLRV